MSFLVKFSLDLKQERLKKSLRYDKDSPRVFRPDNTLVLVF